MNFTTLFGLLSSGQFSLMLEMQKSFKEFYRVCFIATALEEGVYEQLRQGPARLENLHAALGAELEPDRLQAWLELGVSLGELKRTAQGYALRGRLSKKLTEPANDAQRAIIEELAHLHYDLVTQTPARLRQKRLFSLADSDGELIARSSRILEAFVFEAVDAAVPASGAMRLLEVGCGSGIYIRHACQRNPDLTATGLELQPEVAEFARQNIAGWGLAERVSIQAGDIRSFASQERFDLVTLHNNIYYFIPSERAGLARHLASFLKPGGKLLFTTGCQGGGFSMQALNLWGAMTSGAGALPDPDEFCHQLREAGFREVQKKNLLPGDSFYMFVATGYAGNG